uniref:Secreted protein n=1 Tax=Parascaris univalens TaxID=6257 RepID=A0A915ABF9_PARUN
MKGRSCSCWHFSSLSCCSAAGVATNMNETTFSSGNRSPDFILRLDDLWNKRSRQTEEITTAAVVYAKRRVVNINVVADVYRWSL